METGVCRPQACHPLLPLTDSSRKHSEAKRLALKTETLEKNTRDFLHKWINKVILCPGFWVSPRSAGLAILSWALVRSKEPQYREALLMGRLHGLFCTVPAASSGSCGAPALHSENSLRPRWRNSRMGADGGRGRAVMHLVT